VSGILRTLATTLSKIANDMRLMASGPDAGLGEIILPKRQAGSSIMPGKVNPVIPEAVAQAALAVMGYDQMILQAVSGGNLQLSQFLPLVADSLLTSLDLMHSACDTFTRHCVLGVAANGERCRQGVDASTATVTALIEEIGYEQAEQVALAIRDGQQTVREAAVERGLLTNERLDELLSPERVMQLGFVTTESVEKDLPSERRRTNT